MSRVPDDNDLRNYNPVTGLPSNEEIHPTDAGNADRLVRDHGHDLLWCDPWKTWLVWDGKRYAADNTRQIERRAKQVVRSIYTEAARLDEPARRTELAKFAMLSERAERINAMIRLARSEPSIAIVPEKLDADPWKLNCGTGIIDLKTGERFPHERSYMMTRLCPTGYVGVNGPKCDKWLAFLKQIFAGNDGLIQFVQRLLGYSLVGAVYEHVLPVFYGSGANGKTVLVETVLRTIGDDYSCKAASDLLLMKRDNSHPCEKADLFGKRLVVCSETDDGRRLAESTVKELSGGDTVKARRMRENFWQFKPSHTAILVTNHKPVVRGTDHGIWRRLRLVPFTVTIPPEKQDTQLIDKLLAERAGILKWLVDGCLGWQAAKGLGQPPEVEAATADYRHEQDTLGLFIDDRCKVDPLLNVKAGDLYAAYKDWSDKAREFTLSQRKFGAAMTERGFERYPNNGTWYRGIGINEGY
jgi:putative DNA primase/helicase